MSLATGGRDPVILRSLVQRLPDIATQVDKSVVKCLKLYFCVLSYFIFILLRYYIRVLLSEVILISYFNN